MLFGIVVVSLIVMRLVLLLSKQIIYPSTSLQDTKLVGAMTNLKPCKGKDEAKLAAKARTACLTQMRACNSYVELVGSINFLWFFLVSIFPYVY